MFVLSVAVALTLAMAGCGSAPKTVAPPPLKISKFTKTEGLGSDQITTLTVYNGQVWAGTKEGLSKYDGVNWQLFVRKNCNALVSNTIEELTVADNILWVATENGITKYDGQRWSSALVGQRARSVAARGNEAIAATASGIKKGADNNFTEFNKANAMLINDEVNVVAYDTQNRVWVGTRAGMALFGGSSFNNYSGPAKTLMGSQLVDVPPNPPNCKLIGNFVTRILPYKNLLAVGTTSGLSLTDMDNQYINYFAEHKDFVSINLKIEQQTVPGNCPMPGNNVTALAKDPGENGLIVGTNKGLAILEGTTTWVTVDHPELPKTAITGLTVQGDALWIGTASGLYRASPLAALAPKVFGAGAGSGSASGSGSGSK